MHNPFEDLIAPKLEKPEGEEISGHFVCQERECYMSTTTARYLEEVSILSWICPEGHISKIEGFKL